MLLDDVASHRLHTSGRLVATGKMHLSKINHPSAALYRAWLRRLPDLTGKTLTAIAKEIGVAPSTLTRPLKPDDPGTSTPNQTTIDKIVARYGVAPPAFAAPALARRSLRGFSEDAAPYSPEKMDGLGDAVLALAAGRNNAGPWIMKTKALDLAGLLPGDVVIIDFGLEPQIGDMVCAQVSLDFQRGAVETVIRIYERAGAANVLVGASTDPAFRSPISVDDRVTIKGVAVGMVRPILRAA